MGGMSPVSRALYHFGNAGDFDNALFELVLLRAEDEVVKVLALGPALVRLRAYPARVV